MVENCVLEIGPIMRDYLSLIIQGLNYEGPTVRNIVTVPKSAYNTNKKY